jgi:hypothetical protein
MCILSLQRGVLIFTVLGFGSVMYGVCEALSGVMGGDAW